MKLALTAALFALLLLAGVPPAAVQSQAAPPLGRTYAEILANAAREGSLNIVWSSSVLGEADTARQHIDAFNKLYGLHLTYRFAAGPSMATQGDQLYTEFNAGAAASSDILFSSGQSLAPLLKRGMFFAVPWTTLRPDLKLPADLSEAGGQIVRVGTSVPVVVYNTSLMPKPPASLQGLLDPRWHGKLATPPNASGFDVLSATDFWGLQRAVDYVQKFTANAPGLVRCGDDDRVASGEYAAFVMDCSSQGARMLHEKGAPVDLFIPSDAAQLRFYYIAVPKNAPHPNAAVLFALYLLSPPGQSLFYKTMRMDLHELPGSQMAAFIKQYQQRGVKFVTISSGWWEQHPEALEGQKKEVEILSASR